MKPPPPGAQTSIGCALALLLATAHAQINPSPPAPLNTNAHTDSGFDGNPHVATDGMGTWVAVWEASDSLGGTIGTDFDILFARSNDNGLTWSPPAPLNTNAGIDTGGDHNPQIAAGGMDTWVVVWESTDTLGETIGSDHDILFARSNDNGLTWSPPVPLNTNAATDSGNDQFPHVATGGMGTWIAVWHSTDTLGETIGPDPDVLFARSNDNGITWTPPVPLNNATIDAGNDFLPRIATNGMGAWVAVWESTDSIGGTIGTDSDIFVVRSTDNGLIWSPPAPLNTNAPTDSGNDFLPDVTTDGMGTWIAVWDSNDTLGGTIGEDFDILFARSTNNGLSWTPPAPLNTNAATDSAFDRFPRIATNRMGAWIAVWESTNTLGGTIGTDRDILMAHSTDKGLTWSPPAPLNTNAATDSGNDFFPQIAADGMGAWIAVWESTDTLGETIGPDHDILVTTFQFGLPPESNGCGSHPRTPTNPSQNWLPLLLIPALLYLHRQNPNRPHQKPNKESP